MLADLDSVSILANIIPSCGRKYEEISKESFDHTEGKIKDDFLRSKITLAYKNLLAKEKIDFPNFVIGLHTDTKNYHYHIGAPRASPAPVCSLTTDRKSVV